MDIEKLLEIAKTFYRRTIPQETPRFFREPIVPSEIKNTILTVSERRFLVMSSKNLFISDIDPWLMEREQQEQKIIEILDSIDKSWRLYRTFQGWRVICTSEPMFCNDDSVQLMMDLHTDPKYIALCKKLKNYRARLTVKNDRDEDHVCDLVKEWGSVHPDLEEQLDLHDSFCLIYQ